MDEQRTNRFTTDGVQQRVAKPWGEEIIYTPEDSAVTGKVLYVKAGKRLSLQYHEKKEETLTMQSGKALLWIENRTGVIEKVPMIPLHGYMVRPLQKHRVEAIEDSVILESSTPELGTTVRIDDDFARPDETDEIREQPGRGWKP